MGELEPVKVIAKVAVRMDSTVSPAAISLALALIAAFRAAFSVL